MIFTMSSDFHLRTQLIPLSELYRSISLELRLPGSWSSPRARSPVGLPMSHHLRELRMQQGELPYTKMATMQGSHTMKMTKKGTVSRGSHLWEATQHEGTEDM